MIKNKILEDIKNEKIELNDIVEYNGSPTCLIIIDKRTEYPYSLLDLDIGRVIKGYKNLEAINNDNNIKLVCKSNEIEIRKVRKDEE